jgi:antiviral helicase SKI2
VLTELILENTLASYEPAEVVALLSCFVFQEKTDNEPSISPKLEEGRDAILAIEERVGRVQDAHKVAAEESRALKFGLMEVVYEWAKGTVSKCYELLPQTIDRLLILRSSPGV